VRVHRVDHFDGAVHQHRGQGGGDLDHLLHFLLLARVQLGLQRIDVQYVSHYLLLAYAHYAAYLVEIFPYFGRSRGISWFQFYSRGASFFATYVNPVGLKKISWRWLLVYCCWLVFELVFIYFFFPETSGRTLEELSFSKFPIFGLCTAS
jgi:hypothetical protein